MICKPCCDGLHDNCEGHANCMCQHITKVEEEAPVTEAPAEEEVAE